MTRPTLFWTLCLALLLAALLGPWCCPAYAAPPVQRDSRATPSDPYADAAVELGFPEWGKATSNEQVVHITARFDAERIRVVVLLPPTTSLATAEPWLQSLSDAMGWQDVALSSNAQPESLLLRADVRKSVRRSGFGTSEARLDLARLTTELRKLTPKPALLGVRIVGAELQSASVPPVAGGRSEGNHYLFYRLNGANPPARPLTFVYGIPRRWLVAGATGLLLWLLFPVAALFAVLTYLLGLNDVEVKQRLALYRRWQRGVLVVPTVVAIGALILSRFSFLTYFGTAFAFAVPLAIVLPSTAFALAARLIGMPLERAAWPQRAELPWYRIVSVELGISALILVMVGGTSISMPALIRSGGGAGTGRFFILPMLVPLLFGLGALVWGAVTTHRRKKGTLPNEVEAPEELTATVRELTARLGCPIERVRLVTRRDGLLAGNVAVLGDLAVLGHEITETLEPDQVAALIAAAALAQPRTRTDRWIHWGLSVGLMLPALALLGWMALSPSGGTNRSLLPVMVLLGPFTIVTSMANQRRIQKRQEQADLQAAEALSAPHQFLQALRQLEELQVAAGGLDSTTARNAAVFQRRTRLERRLGLE